MRAHAAGEAESYADSALNSSEDGDRPETGKEALKMKWLYELSRYAMPRQIARATGGVLLGSAVVGASAAPEMTFKLTGFGSAAGAEFQSEMQRARSKVREWWGATFEGSISIETNTDRVLSMELIPAWRGERGQMIFGAKRVNAGQAATAHEMIHVYAPNANRFLAEGLAVYGHDVLGRPPAYPNSGKSLADIAGRSANRELAVALERMPTPNPLESVSKEGEAIAGSFVKFLIERHGMDKFRVLYALTPLVPMQRDPGGTERWQQIYGESFEGDRGRLAHYAAEKVKGHPDSLGLTLCFRPTRNTRG